MKRDLRGKGERKMRLEAGGWRLETKGWLGGFD
jgi:hypothetical protein